MGEATHSAAPAHQPGREWQPPPPADDQLYPSEIRETFEDYLEMVLTQQRMARVLRAAEDLRSDGRCKNLDITRTNLGVCMYRVRHQFRECLGA